MVKADAVSRGGLQIRVRMSWIVIALLLIADLVVHSLPKVRGGLSPGACLVPATILGAGLGLSILLTMRRRLNGAPLASGEVARGGLIEKIPAKVVDGLS